MSETTTSETVDQRETTEHSNEDISENCLFWLRLSTACIAFFVIILVVFGTLEIFLFLIGYI